VDYSLTPKGILQAQQTAEALRAEKIDTAFTSPLKRAIETAEIIAAPHNLPVTIVEDFRELNVGELEKYQPTPAIWQQFDGVTAAWQNGDSHAAFPGGEDHLTLISRARQAFEQLLDGKSGQTTLIVAHGGIFFYTLRQIFTGLDPAAMQGGMHNCSITELEAWMQADGLHGRVVRYAAVDHLNGEAAQFAAGHPKAGDLYAGEE
jgi:broad specificity phosphatase PhoE